MTDFFEGRVAVVTGASSGIGEALAGAFGAAGAYVVLAARNTGELTRVEDAIRAAGGTAHHRRCDVTSWDDCQRLADFTYELHGRCDYLVANAGRMQRAPVLEATPETYRAIFDVNFFGTLHVTKAFLPRMLAAASGHLVCISSLAGLFATQFRSAYSSSKFAIRGLYDALRLELWDTPLRVTTVYPGYVRTNISRNSIDGSGIPGHVPNAHIESGADPDELAQAVLDGLRRGRREIVFARWERVALWLQRVSPALLDRVLAGSRHV
jgi:NAD(P)-dependent dehydrogenase (short-subunit alcohol dehydrogenase family)